MRDPDRIAGRLRLQPWQANLTAVRASVSSAAQLFGSGSFWQDAFDLVVGPRNDMHGYQLADASCGGGACVGCSLDGADVTTDHDRDIPGADVFLPNKDDVRSLDHGVGRLDRPNE